MTTEQEPYKKALKKYTQVLRKKLYSQDLPTQEVDLIKDQYLAELKSTIPNNHNKSLALAFSKVIFELRTINIEISSSNQRYARKYPKTRLPAK